MNGESTLGENLSDNGGIRASYIVSHCNLPHVRGLKSASLKKAYKRVAGKTKKLPGLTKYTDDQLFFIGFGQVRTLLCVLLSDFTVSMQAWCTYFTASSISNQIRADEHAPEVVR